MTNNPAEPTPTNLYELLLEELSFLKSEYDWKDGKVVNPGKYQGEGTATLFYHENLLLGERPDFTSCDSGWAIFRVRKDEGRALGIPALHYFAIKEDDNGFVHGRVMTRTEVELLMFET